MSSQGQIYLGKIKSLAKGDFNRVNVQVKSIGSHFACLCWEFDVFEVEKILFFEKKREILLHF